MIAGIHHAHFFVFFLTMADSVDNKVNDWLSPLKKSDGACYLVGGAVRDRHIGRSVTDMDFACRNAKHLAEKLASAHGTALVPFTKKTVGNCYRLINRENRNDYIDISDIRGDSITADLALRDFTINAMAVKIDPGGSLGKMIDPFRGVIDIQNKSLRIVGPDVFAKDALRILRAVRFSAELGFTLTSETIALIPSHANLIDRVTGERVWTELQRILQNSNSIALIRWMDEWRVLTRLFPEIKNMKNCPQNAHHHLDVWPHSLMVLRHCEKIIHDPARHFKDGVTTIQNHFADGRRVALLKLAALLHDVGKPYARGVNPSTGRITFYGHDKIGADLIGQVARRLRLSNADCTYLITMVAKHLHVLSISHPKVRPATRTAFFRKLTDDTISLIIQGMADVLATRGPDANRAYREAYLTWAKKIIANFDQSIKPLLSPENAFVRGKDLLALGVRPGPGFGKILGRLRRAQDDGHIQDRSAALSLAKKWITAEVKTGKHTKR